MFEYGYSNVLLRKIELPNNDSSVCYLCSVGTARKPNAAHSVQGCYGICELSLLRKDNVWRTPKVDLKTKAKKEICFNTSGEVEVYRRARTPESVHDCIAVPGEDLSFSLSNTSLEVRGQEDCAAALSVSPMASVLPRGLQDSQLCVGGGNDSYAVRGCGPVRCSRHSSSNV